MSAMYFFIKAYLTETNRKKLLFYSLFYVACTLAFYTKGFIGIVIPGLSILTFLVIERNLKEIIKMRLWLGFLIFFAMTLPWFIALWHQAGTEYLNVFFVHNHLQRFFPAGLAGNISGAASGHHNPFYYYITEFPSGFLPWSILIIPVLFHAFSKSGKSGDANVLSEKGTLFAKCWFFAGIIFLSIASTKRTLYLMPIFAPIAMLTAAYIDSTLKSPQSLTKIGKIFYLGFHYGFALCRACPDTCLFLYQKTLSHAYVRNAFGPDYRAFDIYHSAFLRSHKIFSAERPQEILDFNECFYHPYAVLCGNGCYTCHGRSQEFCPFLPAVTATVPVNAPLYGYQPDETLRGAVPFYTGRNVIETEDLQDIMPLLKKDEPFFIMIRDKREQTEKELLNTGKLYVLVKQMMGTDRTLVLLSNVPTQRTITIGDPFEKIKKEKTDKAVSP